MELFWFLLEMPYKGYFELLAMLCMIYAIISVILFRFWIIPKVENRYRKRLRINIDEYSHLPFLMPFASWGIMTLELSVYIVSKYIGWDLPGVKKPLKCTLTFKLKEIYYDIHTASKAEIVLSFMKIFSLLYFFIGGFILTHEW